MWSARKSCTFHFSCIESMLLFYRKFNFISLYNVRPTVFFIQIIWDKQNGYECTVHRSKCRLACYKIIILYFIVAHWMQNFNACQTVWKSTIFNQYYGHTHTFTEFNCFLVRTCSLVTHLQATFVVHLALRIRNFVFYAFLFKFIWKSSLWAKFVRDVLHVTFSSEIPVSAMLRLSHKFAKESPTVVCFILFSLVICPSRAYYIF